MSTALPLAGVGLLLLATVLIGVYGLRISRTTSDFFVASRTVRPVWNASAISGEYLSAGTFLGLSGLALLAGAEAFWFPVGYAAGYLLVLLFVAGPLRRSGAYTIPDLVQARLDSLTARRVTSVLVLVIGWLYVVPQLHGAALVIAAVAPVPPWVGSVGVAAVVATVVAAGGMRSITFVQAFQYWVKLTALTVPVVVLLVVLGGDGGPLADAAHDPAAVFPPASGPAGTDAYATTSLLVALLLGTIGLPHVLVRFYTSPDGGSARRTTVVVIVMISVFYVVSSTLGLLARVLAPDLAEPGRADTVVLLLPTRLVPGLGGELLAALVVAGAFAAFLGTSSGLVVALAGVVSQDLFGGTVRSFRWSAVACTVVPLAVALLTIPQGLVTSVGTVFVFAASALSPVILLAVWWRGLTARGAVAGMVVGAVLCATALLASSLLATGSGVTPDDDGGLAAALLAQPAAWTVPLATATVVVVSLLDRRGPPPRTDRFLRRLHVPEVRRR
ncbi:sodium/solute symporter [Cellulosimicrobium marinum]|uniref:sodium/solute symporter n=1 Tax=Cellulosimicrobium marinum TaxID=1638992 RepID=UPI001E4A1158|nr:cation acetate symporter [Cellulosimicrobium marinum]MCB7135875.1 cation acetate symporter [Cellulosimicrobium marinum]